MKTPKGILLPDISKVRDENVREIFEQLIKAIEENHRNYYDDLRLSVSTLPVNATTPSVRDGKFFITANTNATAITDFTQAQDGQEITIICNDVNTSIVDGGNFRLSANWTPNADDILKLVFRQGVWRECSRSAN